MYEYEEQLFGVDMRHRPPLTILPTQEHGWASSRGRLAYSSMNRRQELNYSEYALTMMGTMPKGYVIVNESEIHYNTETAFRVSHNRVAIPVKEFAKQKKLSLEEQWELMNPQWVGTYFGFLGEDPYRNRRPSLAKAISDAMEQDRLDEFMSQFWSAEYDHRKAIERLEHRAKDLESLADGLQREYLRLDRKVKRIRTDISNLNYTLYHLQGYNVHELLASTLIQRDEVAERRREARMKARRIKEYLKSITF